MKKAVLLAALHFTFTLSALVIPIPTWAERPAAIKATIKDTAGIESLRRQNYQRSRSIFNDYLLKSKQLDKMDNDVLYHLNKASQLQGEQLRGYIQKYVAPKNNEMMRFASEITSPSKAIRELNEFYMECLKIRMRTLNYLCEITQYKVPAQYVRSYTASAGWACVASPVGGMAGAHASVSEYESWCDEHVPYHIRTKIAQLRSSMDELYIARNKYYNRRAYIERNVDDVITEDDR